ncbi:hypothetical protein B0H11DRAFT_1256114 [Mycena galericulata]|nr:hypothetical protein B0H11DRAFT_1256114 [Mycena galericulata]
MAMDEDTLPLLAGTHASDGEVAQVDRPPHFCTRCSSELESRQGHKDAKVNSHRHLFIIRLLLSILAILISCLMFAFAVVVLAASRYFHATRILQLFVALWTDVTITSLILLLYMGRRRETPHPLGRTTVQIYVLLGLACSWIIFMVAMLTQNEIACGWGSIICGFFTAVHVLSWILVITLLLAAYVTYRRAVAIHGSKIVVVPSHVPAWRLSDIADGEGAIKI